MMRSSILNKRNAALLVPIPALLMGAVVMRNNELSCSVYGQNIVSYLLFCLILLFFGVKPVRTIRGNQVKIVILVIGCLAVAFTFLDRGMENVHRWLSFGGFRLYIASIILPCMIIVIGMLLQKKSIFLSAAIALLMVLILARQPDASQLSAFAISTTFMIWIYVEHRLWKIGAAILSVSAISYSWLHLDSLTAVSHVEDILLLTWDMGIVWFLLGISSLALLLIPFMRFSKVSMLSRAVGIYYFVIIVSTFLGNFPVPFMGFGISPIIGYLLVLFFLIRQNTAYDDSEQKSCSKLIL